MPSVHELLEHGALGACDVVGANAHVWGLPLVDNQGRIEIGRDFEMSAMPVRSHIATGQGGFLRIGDRVRIAHGSAITAYSLIEIGDDVDVGPFVMILDVDFHGTEDRAELAEPRPIHIGSHVRIGAGAVILRGARIDDGARILPQSVVARHVPAGARFGGAPARPMSEPPGKA